MTSTPHRRPGDAKLPTLVAGLLVGALVGGGLVPLVGSETVTTSPGTPDFLSTDPSGAASAMTAGGATVPGGGTGSAAAGGGSAGSGSSDGQATDPGASGAGPTPGSAPAALTASDVGVTPEVIRIGAETLNCEGCAAFGVETSPNSHGAIAQAFVEDINQRGGIHGRRVELFTADYDPVEDGVNGGGTQRAACIALTERHQVFAVVQGGTFENSCIYGEHATTLITNVEPAAVDPDTFNQSEGRLWTINASTARTLTNWARQLVRQGIVAPGLPFGVVTQEVNGHDRLVQQYLVAELTRLGVPPTRVSVMPGNIATFPLAASSEGAAMRRAGIQTVLLALDAAVNTGLWIQEAERNGWRPQYLLSEFPSGANDFVGGQQPDSFAGAIAISNTPEGSLEQVLAEPSMRRCLDIWERASGATTLEIDRGWVATYCNAIRLFEIAATNAGPNLTRETFAQGMAAIGSTGLAGLVGGQGRFGGPTGFGPVQWSAATITNTKVWTVPCPRADSDGACWVETRQDPMEV